MRSVRNGLGLYGLGTAVVLLVSGVAGTPALAASVQGLADEVPVTASAPDEASALSAAVAEGHDVVVDSQTTETSQVVAQPDGTFELTVDAVPVRVRQDSGWVAVDTTLASGETGWLSPVASTVPVQFSGGGSKELAQVQLDDGSWLVETWPLGSLPAPQIEGASATYADVLPDVDLRLTATADGMSEVFIIHSEEAAQNPDLLSLKVGVQGATVAEQADGLTTVVPEGEQSEAAQTADLRSNAPHSWDSSDAESGPDGPGGDEMAERIPLDADGEGLTLDVDAVVDADVTYPLYVDPDWAGGQIHAWYIDATYPNQAYVDGGAWTDGDQQMGFIAGAYSADGQNQLARAFWQMPTSAVAGKTILAAAFNTTLVWGFNCTPSPMELWRVDGAPVGGTWNSTGGASWAQYLDGKNVAAGRSGCPATGVGFNVQAGVAAVAAASGSSITLGMKASNEGSSSSWKRWAVGAQLIVTYNSIPNAPTAPSLSSPARACGTSSAPAWVNGTAAITMQAAVTDPDPGNVAARFYVVDGTNLTTNKLPAGLAPSGYLQSATQAQGLQAATVPANAFSPGLHAWRATTWDGISASAASGWCYFQVKNTAPGLPTLLSRASGPYTVGQPTTVRFASNTADKVGVFAFWWSYSGSTSPSPAIPVTVGASLPACDSGNGQVRFVCPAADGTSQTVTIAPVATSAVLWVASIDLAGNVSVSGGNTATAIAYTGTNTALADTTRVSYSNGHGWPTVDLTSPISSPILDANTNSGTSLTSAKPLSLSALVSKTASAAPLPGDSAAPVFETPNLIALNRYYNPATWLHYEMTGAPPAGFQYEMTLGWIMPPIGPGQTQPTGTSALYRCMKYGNEDFLSSDPACEGRGNSPVLQGYVWFMSQPTPPPGASVGLMTACNDGDETATPDYDESCSPKWSLGYTILAGKSETTGPAVDTTQSFTTSAWLKPGILGGRSATALSQSGASKNGFALKVGPNGRWQFCLQAQVGTSAPDCVEGAIATAGSWQFVTGTWDAANQQLRINVGDSDTPDAVAWRPPVAGDTAATGKVMLAGLSVGGASTEAWFGQISHPTIFPGVAEKGQRQNLYFQSGP